MAAHPKRGSVRVDSEGIALRSMHVDGHLHRHGKPVAGCKALVGGDNGLDMVKRIVESDRKTRDINFEFGPLTGRSG